MQFLTDDWLCDVATDYSGKCVLVAYGGSIIERTLLDTRPVFFITAGRRGGGKTTVLQMILLAITGVMPSAAAWSPNEEERRKSLLSYLMSGTAHLLWDNIPRGLQISCPHIEKACTISYYSDRRLCASEIVTAAASAIQAFTGNNIGAKGDLASRALHARLAVDRIDPENREFKRQDPIGWTRANRAKILRAFYTILLGNPTLRLPPNAKLGTRFKLWQRLVGSAVEHGAQCAAVRNPDVDHVPDKVIDFAYRDQAHAHSRHCPVPSGESLGVLNGHGPVEAGGYSLRDALELTDELRFRSQQEEHELSDLYEAKIRRMGNAGRNGGEYYTPRPLIRAIIKVAKPHLCEPAGAEELSPHSAGDTNSAKTRRCGRRASLPGEAELRRPTYERWKYRHLVALARLRRGVSRRQVLHYVRTGRERY
jgi:N-6 DNA Methylase